MGDVADMMLDGTLCQGCGEYLGDGEGCPMFCESCSKDDEEYKKEKTKKETCSICNKKCKGQEGLNAHIKAKHSQELKVK